MSSNKKTDAVDILEELLNTRTQLKQCVDIFISILSVIRVWECTACQHTKIITSSDNIMDQLTCNTCQAVLTPVLSRKFKELKFDYENLQTEHISCQLERDGYLRVATNLKQLLTSHGCPDSTGFNELEPYLLSQLNYIKFLEGLTK